jgi:hypothetical protein
MKPGLRLSRNLSMMLILLLSAPVSLARDDSLRASEQVPPNIHHVSSGGFWMAGSEEGTFRVIVTSGGIEHVSHQVFVQLLRNNLGRQDSELVRTVSVGELNQEEGQIFEVTTSFGDINAFEIDITVAGRGGRSSQYRITAKGDGSYSLQPR